MRAVEVILIIFPSRLRSLMRCSILGLWISYGESGASRRPSLLMFVAIDGDDSSI